MLLMFSIALIFSVMIPVLLPAAFILFVCKFYTQKYNMVYRYDTL